MAIAKETALVRMANKASTDLTGKEGYVAGYDSGIALAATANPAGAYGGVVRCKAGGTITCGAKVKVVNGGKVEAYASGAGTVIGVALQAAAADELFDVALRTPITFAS